MAQVTQLIERGTKLAKQRLDAWKNALTGIGTLRDKSRYAAVATRPTLKVLELSALFHHDPLSRRIITKLVDDALREGFEVEATEEGFEDGEQILEDRLKKLGVRDKLESAAYWGRLYGGGAILIGARGNPATPLKDEVAGPIKFLTVLERADLQVHTRYNDTNADKFGEVETYKLFPVGQVQATQQGIVIHESRLIWFGGSKTSKIAKIENNGYDHSVLQAVYDVLLDHAAAWGGAINLLSDISQGVFKIRGLIEMIAEGSTSELLTRFELMDQSRSTAKSILVDADGEDFTYVARSVSGVPDLIDKVYLAVSSAIDMPVTVLLGQAPAGLNATGDNDVRKWYDSVSTYREQVLRPQIERILALVCQEIGQDPKKFKVCFPTLWKMTAQEEAALRKTVADTDAVYINSQVLLPEEVALARWGSGKYSTEMQVDPDIRQKLLEQELKNQEEIKNDPEPTTGERVAQENDNEGNPPPGKAEAGP